MQVPILVGNYIALESRGLVSDQVAWIVYADDMPPTKLPRLRWDSMVYTYSDLISGKITLREVYGIRGEAYRWSDVLKWNMENDTVDFLAPEYIWERRKDLSGVKIGVNQYL